MKEDIHPELKEVTVECACGASYETLSTEEDLHVDVCANCHPFYTGESKFLDSEGRISKFESKYSGSSAAGEDEEGSASAEEANSVEESSDTDDETTGSSESDAG